MLHQYHKGLFKEVITSNHARENFFLPWRQTNTVYKSKLFVVLQRFTKKDWTRFDGYAKHHLAKNTNTFKLYKYISESKANLLSQRLDIDIAHKKILKQTSRKSFQNVMSRLLKVVEQYFIWDQIRQNEVTSNLYLLEAYNKRGLYDSFDKLANKMRSDHENKPAIDLWNYFHLLRINHLQFFSDNPIKYKTGDEILMDATDHLNALHYELNVFYKTVAVHFGRVINKEIHLKAQDQGSYQEIPSSNISSRFLELMQKVVITESYPKFEKLLRLFNANKSHLSEEIKSSCLLLMSTFLSRSLNAGKEGSPKDLLTIHLTGLEDGYYFINNRLPPLRLHNIVYVCCVCEDYTKARKIIDSYSPLVLDNYKEQAIALSKGEIYLSQGKYKEAIDQIRDVSFTSPMLSFNQRVKLLQAYFMLYKEDQEFMNSIFKNFNAFLINNETRLSQKSFVGAQNLSKFLKRILRSGTSVNLLPDLEAITILQNKYWLRQVLKNQTSSTN